VSIKPPVKSIRLAPNKTFAGRTDTGRVGCKFCQSHDVVKWGKNGEKQRYRCKKCGKTFCNDGAFPGMRLNARAVSLSLEMYFDSLSLAKITRFLKRAYGIVVSRVSVWNWIQKFVPMVKKLTSRLVPDAAYSWHVDETAVKVKGDLRWFWDGIDYVTRFIVMGHLSEARIMKDAKIFFKGARKQIG